MIRCTLLLGDRSTAGGHVVEGIPHCRVMGTEITFLGARVACPACKSTGVIIGAGPRHPNDWMGKSEALDGDICACRCKPAPVMIASQRQMFHRFTADELAAMGFDAHGRSIKPRENVAPNLASSFTQASPHEARTQTIEIIVSDSLVLRMGSQFGHSAFLIDGMEYGRAPKGWDRDTRENYLQRQQAKLGRDSWGFEIAVTPAEKADIMNEIKQRMTANEPYSLTSNSCSSTLSTY